MAEPPIVDPNAPLPGGAKSNSPQQAWLRALQLTAPIARDPTLTLPVLVETLADKFEAAPALVSERETLSYRALAERANRYARWALRRGVAPGDTLCLLLPNCPDYVAIWLGITRIGGTVSLVNTYLTGDSLARSINLVRPTHVIVGADLAQSLTAVLPQLDPRPEVWEHGGDSSGFPRIDHDLRLEEGGRLLATERSLPSLRDRALYISTSGTTGLPKAAIVSHFRVMQWSHWFAGMMDTRASDRMFNCLPMYHSVGGVVAIGAVLVNGGAVVLRERFSASRFWDDVVAEKCTLFQYIGELCRYLLASPIHPREREHRLRLCCGNGLRPDIWQSFQGRFRIPQILEYYAATESTFSLFNCEGEPGAIGRIPPFLAHRFPVAVIKLDAGLEQPLRRGDGFCVRCSDNEVGEAIGRIASRDAGIGGRFEGYTEQEASAKKVLRHVFASDDAWFRTGDLMRRDERGFFYFVDRIGDTFRWKGENVSTTEVAEALSAFPGVIEAVVYGVALPGSDGRAGMAAAIVGPDFDFGACWQYLATSLPDYACPLFLRIRREIEKTTTFRPKKHELAREGYDPSLIADPIYFNDRKRRTFVPLDSALYESLRTGKLRV